MSKLLEVVDLKKYYPVRKGLLRQQVGTGKAVDNVSFSIDAGKTFGLVGESGCGKTTIGNMILGLVSTDSGKVLFEGRDIGAMSAKERLQERRNIQNVFQDPYGSLDPRMTVADILKEPVIKHKIAKGAERDALVRNMIDTVGLSEKDLSKYPHEFSGGQRQRIVLARALTLRPKLIVCDEPVSALDVSVQAKILNLLNDLQDEFNISYLFIAHGMPAVKHISHDVGVMYLGKLVEIAPADELFRSALHPYTVDLINAAPIPDPEFSNDYTIIKGEIPSPMNPPSGCRFHPRCPYASEECRLHEPQMAEICPSHWVSCHKAASSPEKREK